MESTLGSYAKVIALTQGMINNGLQNVYSMHERLQRLDCVDHISKLWEIRIDLLAPQVLISKSGISFQFMIKLGQIIGPAAAGTIAVEVAGWTISHPLDAAALLGFREAVDLWDAGGVAGDLSSERIYAILLASIADGIVVDPDESICVPAIPSDKAKDDSENTGAVVKCTWREWAAGHAVEAAMLLGVFQKWPRRLKDQGYNPLGVRFNLNALAPVVYMEEGNMIPLGTRNESRWLFEHKHYPENGAPKVESKLNSILVCGTNDASGPSSQAAQAVFKSEVFSRNFVPDALHSGGHDNTYGFWTLNYKHFLEEFVLSRVNVLHEATEISVDPPRWSPYDRGKPGEEQYQPIYKLRRDFTHKDDGGRLSSPMSFSRTGPHYTWTSNSGSGVDQIKHDQPKLNQRNLYSSVSIHSSVASWTPGKDSLAVRLKTSIQIRSKWFEINSGTELGSFGRNCIIAWHIVLRFLVINNVLHIQVTEAPHHKQEANNKNLMTSVEGIHSSGVKAKYEPGHILKLQEFIEGNLQPSIKHASELFQKGFEHATSFVPPEQRDFDFAKAILNQTGDLVVGIGFKPPRDIPNLLSILDLGAVAPAVPLTPPPPPPPPERTALLEWSYRFTFNEERTRARLVLSGANLSSDGLGEGCIEVSFSSAQGSPDTLFSTNKLPHKKDRVALGAGSVEATLQTPISDEGYIKVALDVIPVPPESTVEIAIDAVSEATPGVYLVHVTESWKDPEDDSRWLLQGLKDIINVVVK